MDARILAAAVAFGLGGTASADEWTFSVTPYLWATDVGIGVSLHDRELVDTTIPFEDLIEDLESAVLFRVEAMRGEHGLALDLFDVAIADDGGRVSLPDGSGATLALDAEVGMTILDLTGVYERGADGQGLSFLYGTRVINQREDVGATILVDGDPGATASYDTDDTLVDILVGLRYSGSLPGRWSYEIAADISTGGTEITWSLGPSIGYAFGPRQQYRLTAGYRHMAVDFRSGPSVDMDMTLSGLLVGFHVDF